MSRLEIPKEHYNELTASQQEDLYSAFESIQDSIETLTSIRDVIISGKFSQANAQQTVDDLINNEGFDFLSAIEQYSWSE